MNSKAKALVLILALVAAPLGLALAQATAQDLVDALNGVFGKHPGMRAAHTKGICLTGMFTPSPDAPQLSKALQFAKAVPIIGRFSLGGGNPQAADTAQDNVRGLAIRFDLGNGANTDLVTISAPVFFVQTPELFVQFLQAAGSGDPAKLKAFLDAHPESTRQNAWLMSHPVPASYAGVNYWGVHAFTLTNAAGEKQLIKYKWIPEAGELGLTPDQVKAMGADFYTDELKERLAKGPIMFDLTAILGQLGDPTNDPTLRWDDEESRAAKPLGKLTIDAIAPDATCDAFSFLPGNVVDGIAGPTDDPVFAARSPAYVVSLIRRLTPQ
jgi:catalase